MGFRDLHLFNLAMLARQGCRLLTNPESLCARVLRAKYSPDGELFKVQEGPGISYSWRSIVRCVQALKEGLIWRVGDGSQINIWLDPSPMDSGWSYETAAQPRAFTGDKGF